MTKRLIASLALPLALTAAVPALAGPGSLPAYLLPPPQTQGRGEPSYALSGRKRSEERGWTSRAESIGGTRDQRTVFVRKAQDR